MRSRSVDEVEIIRRMTHSIMMKNSETLADQGKLPDRICRIRRIFKRGAAEQEKDLEFVVKMMIIIRT